MAERRVVELPAQRSAAAGAPPPAISPPAPESAAKRWLQISLSPVSVAVLDLVAIAAGFWLAYYVRFVLEIPAAQEIHSARAYTWMLLMAAPIFLASFMAYGLYEPRNMTSIVDQLFRLVTAVLIALVFTVAVSSLAMRGWADYSRLMLGYIWLGCTLTTCGLRYVWVLWRDWLARRGAIVRTALVVGAGAAGQHVAAHFRQAPELGFRVLGFLDDDLVPGSHTASGLPVLGRIGDLDAVLPRARPNEIILADPTLNDRELLQIINRCEGQPIGVRIYPDVFQMLVTEAALTNLRGLQLLSVHATELRAWQRTLKRLFDIVFSTVLLVALAPALLLIALLVKLDSPGPVFYCQERVGQDGKRFFAIKFRSMMHEAETLTGQYWTIPDDPRRTRLGRWLRRLSIDELPQFINVLVGDMSVVGPRPERPMFVAQFSERVPDYLRRLRVKAGITGWAQVNGLRGDVSIEERTKHDLYYVDNWSLWLDLKIIVRTVVHVLRDRAAY